MGIIALTSILDDLCKKSEKTPGGIYPFVIDENPKYQFWSVRRRLRRRMFLTILFKLVKFPLIFRQKWFNSLCKNELRNPGKISGGFLCSLILTGKQIWPAKHKENLCFSLLSREPSTFANLLNIVIREIFMGRLTLWKHLKSRYPEKIFGAFDL